MDGATYSVRLRDLEARVDELKDQIRRSHTRLALLSDTILSGVVFLWTSGSWPLAVIGFVASITVPLLKMLSLMTLLIARCLGRCSGQREYLSQI